ncbi:MAG: hypothetical protein WAL72_13155 [Streptosporangiaceae bacterium]
MRQTDPERGKSPWRRGVVHDQLVLICPACQESADWTAELERCAKCRSAHLIRRLGQVECLDCGLVREPEALPNPGLNPGIEPGLVPVGGPGVAGRAPAGGSAPAGGRPSGAADSALADEVSRALDRLLGRA